MQHFKGVTTETNPFRQNTVIMGRKTFESLPSAAKPLPDRINIVISKNATKKTLGIDESSSSADQVFIAPSFDEALLLIEQDLVTRRNLDKIFVIGGAKLFEEASLHQNCFQIYRTQIGIDMEGNVKLPNDFLKDYIPVDISKTLSEKNIPYQFERHVRKEYYEFHSLRKLIEEYQSAASKSLFSKIFNIKDSNKKNLTLRTEKDVQEQLSSFSLAFEKKFRENQKLIQESIDNLIYPQHEELQYLNLLKLIMERGTEKMDRTNTGTFSLFGGMMRFDLSESFPLLTTKDVFWRGVCEELFWFMQGKTNSKILSEKKVKIWDPNGSREFLDSLGFQSREEGDLGPVYGFQWRHFGAKYENMHTDYTGQGVDQIAELIRQMKVCNT